MLQVFRSVMSGLLLTLGGALTAAAAGPATPLTVRVVPWGPSEAVVETARRSVLENPAVARATGRAEVRMVSFEIVDPPTAATGGRSLPPDRYRASLFDYTHNRAYVVEGDFKGSQFTIRESYVQPEPDRDELTRAIKVVSRDPELGPLLRKGLLKARPPMPPLVGGDLPVGAADRTVAVLLNPTSAAARREIVGVDMIRRTVVRYPSRAPEASRVAGVGCGVPNAGQTTTSRGSAGQVTITISRGAQQLWSFVAIRPAASSGTRSSGIELRDVFFKGKKVLARAQAPILNVHYDGDACGPYRDWQWEEGSFVARGRDMLPGVRALTAPPETILDNDSDNGNFRGLAYYANEGSVTLVSEMEAGWYRYISEWIFEADGTIRPRFGFDGVENSCICIVHHHNVYWRFDFDIATAANNQVYAVNGGTPQLLTAEVRQQRTAGRTWKVQNSLSGEAYSIVPGAADGVADSYAKGDFWLLLAKAGEIDDGVNCTTCSASTIQIDNFVGPETLTASSDVVVWYGAHFDHDVNSEEEHHLLGPDLIPVGW
jgi:hypothetical protein